MYVSKHKKKVGSKVYESYCLRHSYRDKKTGKVKHKHISKLPGFTCAEAKALSVALNNKENLCDVLSLADIDLRKQTSIGATYLLKAIAKELGIEKALGTNKNGKLALWQIISRIIGHGSRLSSLRMIETHGGVELLGLTDVSKDSLYSNLDWLCEHQVTIEKKLWKYRTSQKPMELFLYDVTSSYLEGEHNELAAYGYNRDKKKGKKQVVVGLLTDEDGYPVASRVFKGNTCDQSTVENQVRTLSKTFNCKSVTLVGDRGMLKTPQINALPEGFNYITALNKKTIEKLLSQSVMQPSLFEKEIQEIEYEGVRYITRYNAYRAQEMAIFREQKHKTLQELVDKKNEHLAKSPRASAKKAKAAAKEMSKKLNLNKWTTISIYKRSLKIKIDQKILKEETQLDGCYAIKTDLPAEKVDKEKIHQRYKDLAEVETAFKTMKSDLLAIRPLFLRKESRTKGHLVVVMLAYMIIHKLKELWKGVTRPIDESIQELTHLLAVKVSHKNIELIRLMKPEDKTEELLKKANVIWPQALPITKVVGQND